MTGREQNTSTKITTDLNKPFYGDGEVCVWIKKVELVAKLTGVANEALFIPLYLEGGALAVCMVMEMEESDQSDAS